MTIEGELFNIQREEFNKNEIQKIPLDILIRIKKNLDCDYQNRIYGTFSYNINRLYYKRIKKVLMLALEKAHTPDSIIMKKNFLPHEEELFETIVKNIKPSTALYKTTEE